VALALAVAAMRATTIVMNLVGGGKLVVMSKGIAEASQRGVEASFMAAVVEIRKLELECGEAPGCRSGGAELAAHAALRPASATWVYLKCLNFYVWNPFNKWNTKGMYFRLSRG
jgi:hypothetical protein